MESYRHDGPCGATGGRLRFWYSNRFYPRVDSSAREKFHSGRKRGCHGKRALTSASALIFFRQLHAMRGRREPHREGTIRRPLRKAARR